METTIQEIFDTYSFAVICEGDYTTVLACNYEIAENYSKYWDNSKVVSIDKIFNERGEYNRSLNFQTVEDEDIEIIEGEE